MVTTGNAGRFPIAIQKQVYKNVNDTITIGENKSYQLGTFGDTPIDYKTRGDRVIDKERFGGNLYNEGKRYESNPERFVKSGDNTKIKNLGHKGSLLVKKNIVFQNLGQT